MAFKPFGRAATVLSSYPVFSGLHVHSKFNNRWVPGRISKVVIAGPKKRDKTGDLSMNLPAKKKVVMGQGSWVLGLSPE